MTPAQADEVARLLAALGIWAVALWLCWVVVTVRERDPHDQPPERDEPLDWWENNPPQ